MGRRRVLFAFLTFKLVRLQRVSKSRGQSPRFLQTAHLLGTYKLRDSNYLTSSKAVEIIAIVSYSGFYTPSSFHYVYGVYIGRIMCTNLGVKVRLT